MNSPPFNPRPKVIAIGLDAADPTLLSQWTECGLMPNLQRLIEKGITGRLRTPAGMADDAVWPSFSTGVWPAEHGRIDYLARLPGHYEPVRFRDHHFDHRPFWELLDRHGIQVAVLDVPKSPKARLVNGIEVNNFRVHGVDGRLTSVPAAIALDLAKRFSADRTDRPESDQFLCEALSLSAADRADFVEITRQSVREKTRVALELLDSGCDFFLAVFKEAHCAGHKLWPPGPDMQAIYGELDDALGQLLSASDDSTTAIVFSDLGMSHNYHGNDMLDTTLRRLERRLLPSWRNLRIESDVLIHRLRRRLGLVSATQGLQRRLAFVIPHNEISGAIRLNLAGREPHGCVASGDEQHKLCDLIEAEMMSLMNVDTGQPAVQEVIRLDQSASGARISYLPDLLVVWRRDAPIRSISSPAIGIIHSRGKPNSPGNHVTGGFYVAAGAKLPSPVERDSRTDANIVDLAPTITELFGLRLPGSEGRSIPAILVTAARNAQTADKPARG